MPHRVERSLVRIFVASALAVAFWVGTGVPIPRDAEDNPAIPAVALEQVELYRLEVTLLVFYGSLLLITPVFSGLSRGRLPTEISTRGAKFVEEADQSGSATGAAIKEMRQTTEDLIEGLAAAELEIDRLKMAMDDNRQLAVDSNL